MIIILIHNMEGKRRCNDLYLNNKITLGTKQTFSGTGKLKHGAKSYGGFLTKAKNIKIDYTVESSKPVTKH